MLTTLTTIQTDILTQIIDNEPQMPNKGQEMMMVGWTSILHESFIRVMICQSFDQNLNPCHEIKNESKERTKG